MEKRIDRKDQALPQEKARGDSDENVDTTDHAPTPRTHITFDPFIAHRAKNDATLYIPGPRERERGDPIRELDQDDPLKLGGKSGVLLIDDDGGLLTAPGRS